MDSGLSWISKSVGISKMNVKVAYHVTCLYYVTSHNEVPDLVLAISQAATAGKAAKDREVTIQPRAWHHSG